MQLSKNPWFAVLLLPTGFVFRSNVAISNQNRQDAAIYIAYHAASTVFISYILALSPCFALVQNFSDHHCKRASKLQTGWSLHSTTHFTDLGTPNWQAVMQQVSQHTHKKMHDSRSSNPLGSPRLSAT